MYTTLLNGNDLIFHIIATLHSETENTMYIVSNKLVAPSFLNPWLLRIHSFSGEAFQRCFVPVIS